MLLPSVYLDNCHCSGTGLVLRYLFKKVLILVSWGWETPPGNNIQNPLAFQSLFLPCQCHYSHEYIEVSHKSLFWALRLLHGAAVTGVKLPTGLCHMGSCYLPSVRRKHFCRRQGTRSPLFGWRRKPGFTQDMMSSLSTKLTWAQSFFLPGAGYFHHLCYPDVPKGCG